MPNLKTRIVRLEQVIAPNERLVFSEITQAIEDPDDESQQVEMTYIKITVIDRYDQEIVSVILPDNGREDRLDPGENDVSAR